MDLRWVGAADEDAVVAAASLFDHNPRRTWTRRFLAQPEHHLCIAYVEGEAAGFVSGVELTHPDKGTEMFLYELGVDERFPRPRDRHRPGPGTSPACPGSWLLRYVGPE